MATRVKGHLLSIVPLRPGTVERADDADRHKFTNPIFKLLSKTFLRGRNRLKAHEKLLFVTGFGKEVTLSKI